MGFLNQLWKASSSPSSLEIKQGKQISQTQQRNSTNWLRFLQSDSVHHLFQVADSSTGHVVSQSFVEGVVVDLPLKSTTQNNMKYCLDHILILLVQYFYTTLIFLSLCTERMRSAFSESNSRPIQNTRNLLYLQVGPLGLYHALLQAPFFYHYFVAVSLSSHQDLHWWVPCQVAIKIEKKLQVIGKIFPRT